MELSQRLGWIGVDVGTHTVKLAQAVRDGAMVRLHRAAVIQRPAAWSGDDQLAAEQPISSYAEIHAALECGGFSGRDAVCALPMNVCELRGLSVPPGSDSERRTMIGDELTEEWAATKSGIDFDFWETEPARAEKAVEGFNVNVIAASRLWVSQIWRDCRRTKLDCWAVDGTPLTMARAVSLVDGAGGGTRVLAVDWGFSNTTLCAVGEERPLYSRRVHDCAFGRVLESIMTAFNVTLDEAQHLSETLGIAVNDEITTVDEEITRAITEAVAPTLEELTRQISRTLQFMEMQRRHLQPTAIWMLGGGAALRGLESYLGRSLPLPVQIWKMAPAAESIPCAEGSRSAVFGSAAALSALRWRAA